MDTPLRHDRLEISTRSARPLIDGRQFWTVARVDAFEALERIARDLQALAGVLTEIRQAHRRRHGNEDGQ